MTPEKVIEALDIPQGARVYQRIAKKLLTENAAVTTADKRQINDCVEELVWIAALKPHTIGVSEYRDGSREVLEIAVLHLSLREGAKVTRIVELIHRAIPYPTLLVTSIDNTISLSLAAMRWSQNEGGKTVLDEEPLLVDIANDTRQEAFLAALSLRGQHRVHLHELYLFWKTQFAAYQASFFTGSFNPTLTAVVAEKRNTALMAATRIQQELLALKSQAGRESQVNRRVQLNLDIKRLEQELTGVIEDMR